MVTSKRVVQMRKLENKVNELNAVIDILVATTEYYKTLEEPNADDILKVNTMVHNELRKLVDDVIRLINLSKKAGK